MRIARGWTARGCTQQNGEENLCRYSPEMTYDKGMGVPGVHSFLHRATPEAEARERARQRLIVALDAPDAASAMAMVARLEGSCAWFKVGLELFVAAGPAVVEPLLKLGHEIFLDLKLHDIPNTVAGAVRSAASLGVRMLTVHAAGGPAMLAAAHEALVGVANPPELLAVTVLTSMDETQLKAIGVHRSPAHQVELMAKMGLESGIHGFVCSPLEVGALRQITGPAGVLVTPGIRPTDSNTGDQKRIATPTEALKAGANYLVVGRPITQAAEPAKAAEAILEEMAGVV
jgi:orotidine-5'-phosphate decarboxylase